MRPRFLTALALLCILLAISVAAEVSHRVRAEAQPQDASTVLLAALRQHVKHVFIIYQENHSFDEYFGTFPGADNLTSAATRAHGFRQYDPIGKRWITPFRITDPDIDSPGHSRTA